MPCDATSLRLKGIHYFCIILTSLQLSAKLINKILKILKQTFIWSFVSFLQVID